MENIYQEALKLIENKEDFSLATVITRDGSAPRGPGAKMIIRNNNSITGTIGGGLLEAVVIEKASEVLDEKKATVEEFHLTGDDFSAIDMTCGGDLKVLIDYIDASDSLNKEVFEYLNNNDQIKPSLLITMIPGNDADFSLQKHSVVFEDGTYIGHKNFGKSELLSVFPSAPKYKVIETKEKKLLIVESLSAVNTGVIFGAGHVGRKVAELLKFIGFKVIIIDDRDEFANCERFPSADEIHVVQSFRESIDFLNINNNTYLIIVTRGHINDENVLTLALKTGAGYIGMIGSKRKRDIIYNNILAKGFTEQDLKRVHAPIGISIGAETPEEIAVSIIAEIVKVRSELT